VTHSTGLTRSPGGVAKGFMSLKSLQSQAIYHFNRRLWMPLWLKCKERKVLPKLRTTHITRARQKVLIKTQIIVANIHGVLVFKQGSASTLQTLSQFILITLLRIANDCPHFRDKETEELAQVHTNSMDRVRTNIVK
jgi:hypothetical protein